MTRIKKLIKAIMGIFRIASDFNKDLQKMRDIQRENMRNLHGDNTK